MRFESDEEKNASNLRKHKVDFVTASRVFFDPWQVASQDREVDGEPRWQTIGLAGELLLLLVVHLVEDDEGEELIRIISAQRAEAHERRTYERSV